MKLWITAFAAIFGASTGLLSSSDGARKCHQLAEIKRHANNGAIAGAINKEDEDSVYG